MKIIKILCGIIIMLCLFQINSLANANLKQTHKDGIYKIVSSKDINKAIEIPGASIDENVQLGIWDFGNGLHQKVRLEYQNEGFYKITIMHTGKSLTIKNNDIKEGIQIVQSEYQELNSQKWVLRDSGKGGWIIMPLSNPELSISIEENVKNGAKLILSSTQDNYNQMFCIYDVTLEENTKENGIYKITSSQNINRTVEIPGGNKNDNIQLGIWDYRKCFAPKSLL